VTDTETARKYAAAADDQRHQAGAYPKTEIAPSVVMFPSCLLRFGVPHLDLNVLQAIGEGEVLATLASEDGALRTPYRKRPAEYRPFSALFAG
jgi:hypothetical protein